jgi:hypothetical protein
MLFCGRAYTRVDRFPRDSDQRDKISAVTRSPIGCEEVSSSQDRLGGAFQSTHVKKIRLGVQTIIAPSAIA